MTCASKFYKSTSISALYKDNKKLACKDNFKILPTATRLSFYWTNKWIKDSGDN